mgnify:CR=1 FL=1
MTTDGRSIEIDLLYLWNWEYGRWSKNVSRSSETNTKAVTGARKKLVVWQRLESWNPVISHTGWIFQSSLEITVARLKRSRHLVNEFSLLSSNISQNYSQWRSLNLKMILHQKTTNFGGQLSIWADMDKNAKILVLSRYFMMQHTF